MWHKGFRAAFIGLALVLAGPARAAPNSAAEFISDLGAQAIHILQTENSPGVRKTSFSRLFTQDFDVPAIGKFVLGRYWRIATPQQRSQYLEVFGQYVVAIYAERFSNYSGEQFKVLGSRANDPATATVSSRIIRPDGGPPVDIDWQVAREGGTYKITDVVVENLSMALTKRDEFASVIGQHNGSIDALIELLRQKVQSR